MWQHLKRNDTSIAVVNNKWGHRQPDLPTTPSGVGQSRGTGGSAREKYDRLLYASYVT